MIMTEHSLTALIGYEMQVRAKWNDFVDGKDGFLYGIPCYARHVVKFNPIDKSLTEIGPDLGLGGDKWMCGVRANNGSIYCAPYNAGHILKINTIDDTVETLENVELPERGRRSWMWASGALASDNNIYYMPTNARRIMKLNTDNDSLSSVGGADIGGGCKCYKKYTGTVVGNDDCLYGIPDGSTRIVKFDPSNPDTTSTVGEGALNGFYCAGKGVLGGDGYIYAANCVGQVLQIDTTSNHYTWIGDRIFSRGGVRWGDPIVGADKCIYWPPSNANRVLKFDPETQQLPSLVGGDLGEGGCKWQGGALASDGVIYCIPYYSAQILTIDPFKELSMTLQNNLRLYPRELGRLFAKDEEEGCDETFYDSAVRKFGIEKVFQLIEECLPTDEEWSDAHSNTLPLFMVAASCENCAASVIYHFLRRNAHALLAN
jgi:hypothetical protein